MPRIVPQELKSLSTIKMQPKTVGSKMEIIMCMDLAGKSGNDIASTLGLGATRVSVIRNSPLYVQGLARKRAELQSTFIDKQSDIMTSGDPVDEVLKSAAITAANKKIDLMRNSASELVASAAAGDILDRAGYKSHTEKTKVSVEVTEKMANRFERALSYESDDNVRKTTYRIEKEVS